MPSEPVLYAVKEMIATITLNRPENRNSMDHEVMPAFFEAVEKARNEKDIRCLIITGTGSCFCSGADFRDRPQATEYVPPHERSMKIYRPFLNVSEIEVPTIAAMNGHAIGGGLGLALICDIRVANNEAKYGATFARLGLHTGMAISYMLPLIVGLPVANELLFTGRLLSGKECQEIGMANYSLDGEEVAAKALELAQEIAAAAPLAVRMIKQSVYRNLDWDPVRAAEWEAHLQSRTNEMEDAKEGISALLEKREPVFKGR